MPGEVTKNLYIYTVKTTPYVLDFLENEVSQRWVSGLFYRAKHRGKERFFIKEEEYEVRYDADFHYHIVKLYEQSEE